MFGLWLIRKKLPESRNPWKIATRFVLMHYTLEQSHAWAGKKRIPSHVIKITAYWQFQSKGFSHWTKPINRNINSRLLSCRRWRIMPYHRHLVYGKMSMSHWWHFIDICRTMTTIKIQFILCSLINVMDLSQWVMSIMLVYMKFVIFVFLFNRCALTKAKRLRFLSIS